MIRLIPSNGTIIINKNDPNIKKLTINGYWSKIITIDSKKIFQEILILIKKQLYPSTQK